MTIFNADMLMNTATQAAFSTSIPPLPEGEFVFTVEKVDFKNPKDAVVLIELTCSTVDQACRDATKLDKPTARYSAFLDLTPTGLLDDSEGKNIGLGRIREAVGQNQPNVPWAPGMLLGQQFRGKVVQKPDSKNPEVIRSEIAAVSAI